MHTTIQYLGVTVHVNKVKGKGTIMGNAWDQVNSKLPAAKFIDDQLAQSNDELICVNGGLFYTYENKNYANGIEISRGNQNQMWDSTYDNVYGLGIDREFNPIFAKQSHLKSIASTLRSAVTANFGIMIDGAAVIYPAVVANYSSISGRTIIGHDGAQWIILSFVGETGKTGLKGTQLFDLCRQVGCKNALCMDGGGSVFLQVNNETIINTPRWIKNAFLIYGKNELEPLGLKIKVVKQSLALRKSLSFVKQEWTDKCPFTGVNHTTIRHVANGEPFVVNGEVFTFKPGESVELVAFLPELQLDGWQWVKVRYNGVIYYAQYDSMAYAIETL